MKKNMEHLKYKNIGSGYLYFYIHFITEVISFFVMSQIVGNEVFLWMCPFLYDSLAFVPQSLIGYISDKYPKIKVGLIGIFLLLLGLISFKFNLFPGRYTEIVFLCFGNACIHINGAEVTLKSSYGKLSHSAIFVSGGSFGVITGKLLARTHISLIIITLLGLTMVPFIILADCYREETDDKCKNFNYHNKKIKPQLVILLAVCIVIIRGYMGYGLPTAWNKTTSQTIMLFCTMGLGKALGGILSDKFGMKKVAITSMLLAIPFLLIGDNLMLISLIGVLLFSMTMAITLGLLVSVLKENPGLAFGLTTIGLFLGTVPIFFFKITSTLINGILIIILTIICVIIASQIIRKDDFDG